MGREITLAQFQQWLLAYANYIATQEPYLTELDAAIGDADHGTNMNRGMHKVSERLSEPNARFSDVGTLFRAVAMTLISSVGGAAGPLYGAFFLRAAKDTNGDVSVSLEQLASMFRSGLEGVQQRGKAQLEEKTMIDALQPAVEALESAVKSGADIETALVNAKTAAEEGMKHTAGLLASKGRASYLGQRSVGHQDPGATSAFFLFQAAAETLGGEDNQIE
jgi:dihydroxyacetone kinase-like protein